MTHEQLEAIRERAEKATPEILAFENGVKRGIALSSGNKWAQENFRYYHGILDSQLGYILFHREDDLRDYRMNGAYAEEFGRLMGYPPIAYENWSELCKRGWDVKSAVDYRGIKFVCFNTDINEAIDWMERNTSEVNHNANEEIR